MCRLRAVPGNFLVVAVHVKLSWESVQPRFPWGRFPKVWWHDVKLIADLTTVWQRTKLCLYEVAGPDGSYVASPWTSLWQLSINSPSIIDPYRGSRQTGVASWNVRCYWQAVEELAPTALSRPLTGHSDYNYYIIYLALNVIAVCVSNCIGNWTGRREVICRRELLLFNYR
jgi:hypothetical protein